MRFLSFLILFFTVISCTNQQKRTPFLPNVTGKSGEVVLVINAESWNGDIGEEFRKSLLKGVEAMPQAEPMFDLINITPGAFSDIYKTHRNLIILEISGEHKEPKFTPQKDVWAKPQVLLTLNANSGENMVKLISENATKIQSVFLDAERNRFMNYYKKYEEKSIREKLLKEHKLGLIVPKGYSIGMDTNNFVWISHEPPDLNQHIFVYYYDYKDKDAFTPEKLIEKRNLFLKKYVSGPIPGSYMTTEEKYPPDYYEINYKGRYFAQLKGLWKVEGYFMGGPFINYTTLDEKRNRAVTVEGAVYAPRLDKRDYMRQLESILFTLGFPD